MSIDDVIDKGNALIVKVPDTKTSTSKGFTIVDEEEIGALKLVRKYMALRPKHIDENRFFIAYRDGRCTRQPVGKNTIGCVPKIIAKYLNLENPHQYTGHCLRRTSSLVIETGGNLETRKMHAKWKSNSVAQSYVEDSYNSKNQISNMITSDKPEKTSIKMATNNVKVVDLRSDTISRPTEEMRDAMRNAEVGDDVYNEDPTVKKLEKYCADLLQKESALFVPTGTMANLIAIMVHCSQRGSELICGDMSHTFLFEQAGAAQIAGAQMTIVKNKPDGTFCLEELKSRIRINPDVHEPVTSLIIVENTHNMCGGTVLPLEWIDELSKIAKEHNIKMHMDGARLFNAVVQSKQPAHKIVKNFDSVYFCLSKSLGVPLGAILCGSETFIEKARRMRKVLGGGMRQIGIIAAAGLVAMNKMIDRLADDHLRAYKIGKAIFDLDSKNFKVNLNNIQTNIFMIYIENDKFQAKDVLNRLNTIEDSDFVKVCVRISSRNPKVMRIVLYHDITDQDVDLAIQKILIVLIEFDKKY